MDEPLPEGLRDALGATSRRRLLKAGMRAGAGLVVLGLADLLAACGGSASSPSAPAATSAAASSSAPAASAGASADVQKAYDSFVKAQMPNVPIDLLTAAKQEGSLNVYLLVPAFNKQLVETFQQTFPFVNTQLTSLNGGPLTAKFLAEVTSNNPIADVAQFSALSDATGAVSKGYVLNYQLTQESSLNMAAGVAGYVVPVTGDLLTIAYNPQKTPDSSVSSLTKWDGILDPQWNGKSIAVGEVMAGGTTQLLNYYLFKTFGTKIWQHVAAGSYGIYPGGNPEIASVVSGERDLAYGVPQSLAVAALQNGDPLHWTNPQAWLATPYVQVISAKAKHPSAAKLFQEFSATEAAQNIFAKYGGISYRKGFSAKTSFSQQSWYDKVDPAQYWSYSDADLGSAIKGIATQWRSIIK